MKRKVIGSILAAAAALTVASLAVAMETRADVETDHVSAPDDGGPRTAGLLLDLLSLASGWLGAELDVSCGENVLLTVRGDERWIFGTRGYRAAFGIALYPQRFSFHGLYAHPVLEASHSEGDRAVVSLFGTGLTVGYAWTWPIGPTVRLGGGAGYSKALVGEGPATIALEGLRPRIDGDIGWVF